MPAYPDALIDHLHTPWIAVLPGISREVISAVLRASFFASLQAEEGTYGGHGLVVVPEAEALESLKPPWVVHRLGEELEPTATTIGKLARCCQDPRQYQVIRAGGEALSIVGLARAPPQGWLPGQDHFPRIRALGPGRLVFLEGERRLLRYRSGEVQTPQPEFLSASGHPSQLLGAISRTLFPDWDGMPTRTYLASRLRELLAAIAQRGHGGMLAILAQGEEPTLLSACTYRFHPPMEFGEAIVASLENDQYAQQIEQRRLGGPPDYAEIRLATPDELQATADSLHAHTTLAELIVDLAGVASVDGAVLMTPNLNALGFGCKLPVGEGAPPSVVRAHYDRDAKQPYELSHRGTRHAAAARFAGERPGRLAFTVSADGPAGCFTRENDVLKYWSVELEASGW